MAKAPRLSGSAAEERIRLKAEAALRAAFPGARIIHELVLAQGGVRIDLAAVTEDRLVLVEVKSERDVLDRLAKQVAAARRCADLVLVAVADKHLDKARAEAGWLAACQEDAIDHAIARSTRSILSATCNAPARLDMLWAAELRTIAQGKAKATRSWSILQASDTMTGRDVRRAVCAALRARVFVRADPPIVSDLFPAPTRTSTWPGMTSDPAGDGQGGV